MENLHMRRKGLKSTRDKHIDTELEDKINCFYCFAQL